MVDICLIIVINGRLMLDNGGFMVNSCREMMPDNFTMGSSIRILLRIFSAQTGRFILSLFVIFLSSWVCFCHAGFAP